MSLGFLSRIIQVYGIFLILKFAIGFLDGLLGGFEMTAAQNSLGHGARHFQVQEVMRQELFEGSAPIMVGSLLILFANRLARLVCPQSDTVGTN